MLRILLIDDSLLFLTSLTELLGLFPGVGVVGMAGNGEEGLQAARELAPDLIFVDMHLPGRLNGLQVAEQLCLLQPSIRVVMLSWHDDTEYRARAAGCGVERFVCKSNMLTKLSNILKGPLSSAEGASS